MIDNALYLNGVSRLGIVPTDLYCYIGWIGYIYIPAECAVARAAFNTLLCITSFDLCVCVCVFMFTVNCISNSISYNQFYLFLPHAPPCNFRSYCYGNFPLWRSIWCSCLVNCIAGDPMSRHSMSFEIKYKIKVKQYQIPSQQFANDEIALRAQV